MCCDKFERNRHQSFRQMCRSSNVTLKAMLVIISTNNSQSHIIELHVTAICCKCSFLLTNIRIILLNIQIHILD